MIRYSALFPCFPVQSDHETPRISSGVSMLIAEVRRLPGVVSSRGGGVGRGAGASSSAAGALSGLSRVPPA